MAPIILDLIKYGDGNTDIASAYIMCLLFRMDLFEEITEDIENLNDPIDTSGFGMNSGRYYIDINGQLKSDSNSDFKMQQFIPHRDLDKRQYQEYIDIHEKRNKELLQRRDNYEKTTVNESMLELIMNEQMKWLSDDNNNS